LWISQDFINAYYNDITLTDNDYRYGLTAWLNKQLEDTNIAPQPDIVHALRDATVLATLINVLGAEPKLKVRRSANRFVQLESLKNTLECIAGMPNIEPPLPAAPDVQGGNTKLLIALAWKLGGFPERKATTARTRGSRR